MSEKKSWDDIPSLEGIGVDWKYKPENPLGKRAYARVDQEKLHALFATRKIKVRIVNRNVAASGSLNDISEGGLSVNLEKGLPVGHPVEVGFFLGEQKVLSRAEVRQVRQVNGTYKVGLAFVDLQAKYRTFLAGVYASMVLNNA